MRFESKPKPKMGETRIKSKFLFLPKKINNQWRWLEKATWEEVFGYKKYDFKSWSANKWLN